jgi:alkylation response protein AidB-like acyl-CoA dehydrogenase
MERTIFEPTHELFRASVREFIAREVQPHFEKWEENHSPDRSLFRLAGAAGFLGMAAPERFGGGGTADFRFNAALIEEFCAAAVLAAGQSLVNQNDVVLPYLVDLADDEQQARWLPGFCAGELVGAIGMTEPGTGSDLAAIATRAERQGDHYVVRGAKQFISNGFNCDFVIAVCKTGESGSSHRNLTLLVVEADREGFTRGRNLHKIGQHGIDTAEIFFDDVVVPVANRLGKEDRAFELLVTRLPQERLSIAVAAVAHAEAAFGWTLEYCKERRAFGQPIGSFQNSRFALATMRTELDIAQVYVDRQIVALNDGTLSAEDAAAAKWWCTDVNRRVLDGCLQLHGGYGYMEEFPIARAWRDGRIMSIYGGTNEIMKELIGRRVLGV